MSVYIYNFASFTGGTARFFYFSSNSGQFSTPRAPCMDPWRSQIKCTSLLAPATVRVEPGGGPRGCGRLPPSRSAPLSATALEHRVRHPASLWGSARRASSAQTRTRLSRHLVRRAGRLAWLPWVGQYADLRGAFPTLRGWWVRGGS